MKLIAHRGNTNGIVLEYENKPDYVENAINMGFDVELARVMVHGLLHLCGYKDAADHEKAEMRNKESFYINQFNLLTTK